MQLNLYIEKLKNRKDKLVLENLLIFFLESFMFLGLKDEKNVIRNLNKEVKNFYLKDFIYESFFHFLSDKIKKLEIKKNKNEIDYKNINKLFFLLLDLEGFFIENNNYIDGLDKLISKTVDIDGNGNDTLGNLLDKGINKLNFSFLIFLIYISKEGNLFNIIDIIEKEIIKRYRDNGDIFLETNKENFLEDKRKIGNIKEDIVNYIEFFKKEDIKKDIQKKINIFLEEIEKYLTKNNFSKITDGVIILEKLLSSQKFISFFNIIPEQIKNFNKRGFLIKEGVYKNLLNKNFVDNYLMLIFLKNKEIISDYYKNIENIINEIYFNITNFSYKNIKDIDFNIKKDIQNQKANTLEIIKEIKDGEGQIKINNFYYDNFILTNFNEKNINFLIKNLELLPQIKKKILLKIIERYTKTKYEKFIDFIIYERIHLNWFKNSYISNYEIIFENLKTKEVETIMLSF